MPIPTPHLTTVSIAEIQTTGSDGNAGFFDSTVSGGVDYTQGAGQKTITFNGTSVTATTSGASATITITGYTVLTGDAGNSINITGGTNFTAGLYTIDSVSTGANTWTLHAVCSSGSGSGLVAVAGGALASPGQFCGINAGSGAFIKAGAYTLSSSSNVSGGKCTLNLVAPAFLAGYTSNRTVCNTDTPPTFQPSANSTTLFTAGQASQQFSNLRCINPGANTACVGLDGSGVNIGFGFQISVESLATGIKCASHWHLEGCFISGTTDTSGAIQLVQACTVSETMLLNCYFGIVSSSTLCSCFRCGFSGNSNSSAGHGFQSIFRLENCFSYGAHLDGFHNCSTIINCIAENSGGYGYTAWESNTTHEASNLMVNFWSYNNTTAAYQTSTHFGTQNINNAVANSGSAFVSPGTTTSANFGLNNTAGAGANVRAGGWPTSLPGLTSTLNSLDGGPAQHAATGGATNFAY